MTTTFSDLLTELTEVAQTQRDKGTQFERLIANYLMTDPQYADRLSDVWLWGEWPGRWGGDDGIDIVAREHGTGDYWAIQCKFYAPTYSIQKADIDSFFTASGKRFTDNEAQHSFSNRLLVCTTDKWSSKAEEALNGQTIPVSRLWFKDLANSPIDWSQFSLSNIKDIRLKKKKELRPHQTEASGLVTEGFATSDRGKLIMACGTGKTFASLRMAEQLTPPSGRILFLAPSISLVSQSLREWTAEALNPIHAFVVCSDSKVGKDEEDIRTHDLAYPATTDARKLAAAAQAVSTDRRTVVFSTYQSIQVVSDAQKLGFGEFDLIVCDEAHRTTGLTLPGEGDSEFNKVHHNHIVRAKKRLYMTATPRIYADASKTKAGKSDAVLYSMDDLATYGPEFYRLGFGKAVTKDLLSEYKVLIVAVEEAKMANLANSFNDAYKIDGKTAIDIRFATKIVGSWKGLSKQGLKLIGEDGQEDAMTEDLAPMRRAVAFSRTIKDSIQTKDIFGKLVTLYQQSHADGEDGNLARCTLDHVDGGMNALKRQTSLDWLKGNFEAGECRILSNARCLSEGIDVPALDAVVFFDTRESIVDIVQSVGRVMRKSEGKKYGYIILPVCIPSAKVRDYNAYIESDPQFKGIWKVIKALRAHDESLVDEAEFRRKIKVIGGGDKGGGDGDGNKGSGGGSLPLDFPMLPIDAVGDAVYAAIPKKLGDREYWSEWAKSVAQIADRLIERIRSLLANPTAREAFDSFLKGLRDNLNPAVSESEAIEMLAQHIITRPVFEALFEGYSFTKNNAVSKAMQAVIEIMDDHAVSSETESLEKFYTNIRERVGLAKSDKSRQDIIRNLYDTFFNNAFPRMAERLGIVYTPVEVVDFIIHSTEAALRKHFGTGLTDKGVQIVDPFTGTGTFIVRLLQSGLIKPEDLAHKYQHEIHANELVLLAYYIAAINIESSYHALVNEYRSFDGIVLTDTFQMGENGKQQGFEGFSPENSERVNRQRQQEIRVVMSNPPYSAQQDSENDNNQNLSYPTLDDRIRKSYAAQSNAKLVKNLYDSYIRAIRWASDRIPAKGIVAFVTNGSFLAANNMDGLRKCLTAEFSHLYVFNLRGFIRGKSKDRSQMEGGNIFDIVTGVAITLMVKDPAHSGPCELHYHDIGDYLSREEKLTIIEGFGSIYGMSWQSLVPNAEGDWAEQRDPAFDAFVQLGNKDDPAANTIFATYSLGVVTNRDPWAYSFTHAGVESNIRRMIDAYSSETNRYVLACKNKPKDQEPEIESVVDTDPKRISWTRSLKADARRGKKLVFEPVCLVKSMYRPFTKQWLYFNRRLNEMVYLMPSLFPTPQHGNIVISCTGVADRKGFTALASDLVTSLHYTDTGQCFPLYWYEKQEDKRKSHGDLFATDGTPDTDGYIRRDGISDWALTTFREHYADPTIVKEDIFWYVYGILHSPEYKRRFATDLKRMLPRIPFAENFRAFCDAGRALGNWHLGYESVEPYPVVEESKREHLTARYPDGNHHGGRMLSAWPMATPSRCWMPTRFSTRFGWPVLMRQRKSRRLATVPKSRCRTWCSTRL
jgi:predicted helicase